MDTAFGWERQTIFINKAPYSNESDGLGQATALGPLVGPCAFSSLAAMPDWIETEEESFLPGLFPNPWICALNTSIRNSISAKAIISKNRRGCFGAVYTILSRDGLLA